MNQIKVLRILLTTVRNQGKPILFADMNQSKMDKIKDVLKRLKQVLFRSKNQHRRSYYYKKTNHIYKLMLKYLDRSEGMSSSEQMQMLKKIEYLSIKASEFLCFTLTLNHFIALCAMLLTLIAQIYEFIQDSIISCEKELEVEARFGVKIKETDNIFQTSYNIDIGKRKEIVGNPSSVSSTKYENPTKKTKLNEYIDEEDEIDAIFGTAGE